MATQAEAFRGGTAVITGAGSGIGAGLATHAALELGMTVVLAEIDEAALERTRAEIAGQGGRVVPVVVDVREPGSLERLAARVGNELGPVRLLVNNAGIEQFGYLWDTPVANWERLVEVNISGVFHGIRAFLPRMLAQAEPAWVLNLSSVGGVAALPLHAAYIMSKHAVLAMTECLYHEVARAGAHHVHVSAVLPGPVASAIFDRAGGVDSGDRVAADNEREEMVRIKEIAMSPGQAAVTIFQQAAADEFYILTHPERTLEMMRERAEQLAGRRAPVLPQVRRFARAPQS